jgi:uncharacterized protein (UPF0548 family)
MGIGRLAPELHEQLRTAPLTYGAVGATAATPPDGYRLVHTSRTLERRDFSGAVDDLLSWRVHERAGLQVFASGPKAEADAVVMMRLGIGPLSLRVPCRVIYVVSELDRQGFAYGTLPGHPESGEERFLLERQDDGAISFTISAFSNAATLPARLGGPVANWIQDAMTKRYLAALDRLGPTRPHAAVGEPRPS